MDSSSGVSWADKPAVDDKNRPQDESNMEDRPMAKCDAAHLRESTAADCRCSFYNWRGQNNLATANCIQQRLQILRAFLQAAHCGMRTWPTAHNSSEAKSALIWKCPIKFSLQNIFMIQSFQFTYVSPFGEDGKLGEGDLSCWCWSLRRCNITESWI